jgi:hypothetical protein
MTICFVFLRTSSAVTVEVTARTAAKAMASLLLQRPAPTWMLSFSNEAMKHIIMQRLT